MSAFALHTQHNLISAGKNGTGTHSNAASGIVTEEMQTNHAIYTFHSALFHHRLRPADDLFGRLKDKFDIAGQFLAALR